MPRYKGDSYADEDYDPDTDEPDTSEADAMLDNAIKGEGDGIGKISTLHSSPVNNALEPSGGMEEYRKKAAKEMIRPTAKDTTEDEESED